MSQCQPDGSKKEIPCVGLQPFCAAGACVACTSANQCTAPAGVCLEATCTKGVCGTGFRAKGWPAPPQTDHDCASSICDGAGGVTTVDDPTDPPLDDGNPCTAEACNPGPTHPFLDKGVTCGGGVCNGAGVCGKCSPGDTRCTGNTVETCSAAGDWTAGDVCSGASPVCSTGACRSVDQLAADGPVCVVLSDKTVRCWGMAVGPDGLVFTPTAVPGLTDVEQVAVGDSHACARRTDGTVSCWGGNTSAQLGVGAAGPASPSPVQVLGLSAIVNIAAGVDTSCAVDSFGKAWCWGDNQAAQQGHESAGFIASPEAVPGVNDASAIAVSISHGCVLRKSGGAACWGYNIAGEMGIGTDPDGFRPATDVPGLAGLTHLGVGGFYTCAGTASLSSCWGHMSPSFGGPNDGPMFGKSPKSVVSGARVEVGRTHACYAKDGIWCWGQNTAGEIGTGQAGGVVAAPTFMLVPAPALLAAGSLVSCARFSSGAMECWGQPVGDGSATPQPSPTSVAW